MILGGHHPATLITLDDLALAYQDAGKLDKALPLFQQAAAGVEKLKFAHDDAGRIVRNLCKCHEQLKQYDQAEVWRRKWLAVVKEKDGPESAAYAEELTGLGSNLLQQKKYADAEPILRECLAILQKKQPEAWDDVPHPVAARRRPAGPAEVRRRRAAARSRLSGDEKVGEGPGAQTPRPINQAAPDRSPGAAGAALRRLGQAGRGGQVAEGVESPWQGRRNTREAKRQVDARYSV